MPERPDEVALAGPGPPDGDDLAPPGDRSIADFLGIPEHSARCIDLRIGLILAVRRLRKEARLSQASLGCRLDIPQSRVAEMENVARQTSFDILLPAFFAAGGTSAELARLVSLTDLAMSR